MSHGEILGESELWQKLNRALMTCSQGQHWLTNGARLFILLTFRAMKDRRIAHLTCERSVILYRTLLVCSTCETRQEIMGIPCHAFKRNTISRDALMNSVVGTCEGLAEKKQWLSNLSKWTTDSAPKACLLKKNHNKKIINWTELNCSTELSSHKQMFVRFV